MPIYRLIDLPLFPTPEDFEDQEGVIAVGGDLSPQRLLSAYRQGIFPWYDDAEGPLLWWCPDPRLILRPERVKVSNSLRKTLKKDRFTVRTDTAFRAVIENCAAPRGNDSMTWLHEAMQDAYEALHRLGFAHSIETWEGDRLVGGLYGVFLGRCFYGESMFSRENDASKVALVGLCRMLQAHGVPLLDCQVYSDHMVSMGAEEIPRTAFLSELKGLMKAQTDRDHWQVELPSAQLIERPKE
ncbi:MAG: leucyl/phenylalanyl-tRNA--protein transferase [Myxococcota bacterium]